MIKLIKAGLVENFLYGSFPTVGDAKAIVERRNAKKMDTSDPYYPRVKWSLSGRNTADERWFGHEPIVTDNGPIYSAVADWIIECPMKIHFIPKPELDTTVPSCSN